MLAETARVIFGLISTVLMFSSKIYFLFRLLGVAAVSTLVVGLFLTIATIKTSSLNTGYQKSYREQSSKKISLLKEMVEGFVLSLTK